MKKKPTDHVRREKRLLRREINNLESANKVYRHGDPGGNVFTLVVIDPWSPFKRQTHFKKCTICAEFNRGYTIEEIKKALRDGFGD